MSRQDRKRRESAKAAWLHSSMVRVTAADAHCRERPLWLSEFGGKARRPFPTEVAIGVYPGLNQAEKGPAAGVLRRGSGSPAFASVDYRVQRTRGAGQ